MKLFLLLTLSSIVAVGNGQWTSYQPLDNIHAWLRGLVATYPDQVTVLNAGKSYEGRDLLGVKVSFSAANENRGIFLEGGIHGNEWISPATVTWMLNEILSSLDANVRTFVERFDWYVFPNFNPDGYVYTHIANRSWQKTRKPYGLLSLLDELGILEISCRGSDPNRNWGYHWMQGGASSDPCSNIYAGTSAFSCPETKHMSEYITSIASKLVGYIAFQAPGQLLMLPFGYQGLEVPANYNQLMAIGVKMINALAAHYGTQYKVGSIPQVKYVASGGSMDWVRGTYPGITLTYTFLLRDSGRYGFVLPEDQIIPTGEETFDSIITMLEEYEAGA